MRTKQKISNDIHYYYINYLKYKESNYPELKNAYYSLFNSMKELYMEYYF